MVEVQVKGGKDVRVQDRDRDSDGIPDVYGM
jgi:hypothetical protein